MALDPDQFERRGACPHCGYRVDVATSADPNDTRAPKGGDVTLCIYCGGLGLFCDDAAIRIPTSEEYAVLLRDPDVQRLRIAWLMNIAGR